MRSLLEFLSHHTGFRLSYDRDAALTDGIRRAIKRAGISDVADYLSHIQNDQAAFDDLLAEVTVGETYFFREPDQLEALRKVILPEILSRKGRDHLVRIWSSACSTGEEPWSLAMVCRTAGVGDQCRILATDISRESLQKAERGTYRQWSLRGPSRELTGSLLHQAVGGWQIDDSLRKHVNFEYLNLALDAYPSLATGTWGCDVIFCRNVLIYFDQKSIEAVVRRLYDSLSPGGWLVLASTDPSVTQMAPFELVEAGACFVYRRPLVTASPSPTVTVETQPFAFDEWVFDDEDPGLTDSTIVASGDVAIQAAQEALHEGDFERVRELTEARIDHPFATALLIRALAGQDTVKAEQACAVAVDRHPAFEELQYLHSILLLDLNRYREAEQAARKTLFLRSDLAIGHFTLGMILQRSGRTQDAGRSFRNAARICQRLPPETVIPLSDGEQAGRLLQMASQHLAMIGAGE
ncbi:MAG: hypothetical protein O3C17_08885 [Planctomycetota bacterium]|nr:hypothetical protein [Planctomycetota bacterium]